MFEEYARHEVLTYAGYIINNDELLECTSGGIATALSKKVLEEGGYVAGVSYSKDFLKAQYEIIDDVKDLNKFKGSKYIEVDKGTIYKDVKQLLDEEKTVLFFGLPCVVAAMKSFLHINYENLITVELICDGPTSVSVHQQYIEHLEKKHNSNVIDFSVRKKWVHGHHHIYMQNLLMGSLFKINFTILNMDMHFQLCVDHTVIIVNFVGMKELAT